MISCQEILEFLSSYLERDLDPETSREVDEHIRDCPPCVHFVDSFREMIDATGKIPDVEKIPPELSQRLHDFLAERIRRTS